MISRFEVGAVYRGAYPIDYMVMTEPVLVGDHYYMIVARVNRVIGGTLLPPFALLACLVREDCARIYDGEGGDSIDASHKKN